MPKKPRILFATVWPGWLIWISTAFPFVHVRRGKRCDRPEPLLDKDGAPVECDSCSTLLVEGQKRFCSRKCARAAEADNDDG